MSGCSFALFASAQVFSITDLLFPDDILAILAASDYQVSHSGIGGGTVPVIDIRRTPDSLAFCKFDNFAVSCPGKTFESAASPVPGKADRGSSRSATTPVR